ncbi:MAG: hypothetical protein KC535_04360 [Nanoarchaeota archaeon]|nr:hypothetical protein [Nanoarchaeota archaeon]
MNSIIILKRIVDAITFGSLLLLLLVPEAKALLWEVSLIAVFLLMCIRPLNDLFPKVGFIRFMPLRKNLGILSSVIVVGFGIQHYIMLGPEFLSTYFSWSYWSLQGGLFWAHLGELTGAVLLVTSNRLSMRLLKRNWKKVQRLSYIYFFSGAWYVFSAFQRTFGLIAIIIVLELTLFAFLKKRVFTLLDRQEQIVDG